MYLHKNRELFRDVILVTSQKLEVSFERRAGFSGSFLLRSEKVY